jgi:prepilin-type N-terminal cleavage/methylation domain-containing protein
MARRTAARKLAPEDGFTLIELLVAMAVTAVGLMALVSSFDHSRDLVSLAEKTEVATHQAERHMERILALPYAQVAHRTAPTHSDNPSHPAFFVTDATGTYQWDQGSTGPQSDGLEVDAVNGSTLLGVQSWEDSQSRLSGEIHTFVTPTADLCSAPPTTCPTGDQRGKRVTVAVTVDGPRPLRRPVLISTIMIDPKATR